MANTMTDREKMNLVMHVQEDEPLVEPWDRTEAERLARGIGVQLSDRHWELVQLLRHHYEEMGPIDYARDLTGMLDQRYQAQGGIRYLYTLFPGGPVTQGCTIAGIPLPKDSSDPAFGYSV